MKNAKAIISLIGAHLRAKADANGDGKVDAADVKVYADIVEAAAQDDAGKLQAWLGPLGAQLVTWGIGAGCGWFLRMGWIKLFGG